MEVAVVVAWEVEIFVLLNYIFFVSFPSKSLINFQLAEMDTHFYQYYAITVWGRIEIDI